MKLTDTHHETMHDILEKCCVVEQKFHTEPDGTIVAIEIKYVPNDYTVVGRQTDYSKR